MHPIPFIGPSLLPRSSPARSISWTWNGMAHGGMAESELMTAASRLALARSRSYLPSFFVVPIPTAVPPSLDARTLTHAPHTPPCTSTEENNQLVSKSTVQS